MPSCRNFAVSLAIVAAVGLQTARAQASLIVYEGFNYGAVNGTINGQSGGSGMSGSWSASSGSYLATGLTFGPNLSVSGGAAVISSGGPGTNSKAYSRFLGLTQTGTIFGSYLIKTTVDTSVATNFRGISALVIGPTANDGTTYDLAANEFGTNNGGVRGVGTPGYPSYLTGVAPSLNTTYLFLFKLTNVGSPNETTSAWILDQPQYDHFKTAGTTPGTLLESDLNAAATGVAATNVLERGSFSGTATGTFTTTDMLSLFAFATDSDTTTAQMDELRIANGSLNEVAVPEPGTLGLTAAAAICFCAVRAFVRLGGITVRRQKIAR